MGMDRDFAPSSATAELLEMAQGKVQETVSAPAEAGHLTQRY